MDSEKRLLVAIVLSLGIYLLFQALLPPPPTPEGGSPPPTPIATPEPEAPPAAPLLPPAEGAEPIPVAERLTTAVEGPGWKAELTNVGAGPVDWTLDEYEKPVAGHWIFGWIFDCVRGDCGPSPLACGDLGAIDLVQREGGSAVRSWFTASAAPPVLAGPEEVIGTPDSGLIAYRRSEGPLWVTTRWRLPEGGSGREGSYLVGYEVTVENRSAAPVPIEPRFAVVDRIPPETGGRYDVVRHVSAYVDGGVETWKPGKLDEKGTVSEPGPVQWGGLGDNYFLSVLVPPPDGAPMAFQAGVIPRSGGGVEEFDEYYGAIQYPAATLAPGQAMTWKHGLFMGPKQLDVLEAAGPSLGEAVDFGWFGAIARPLLWLLGALYGLVGSWGVAIILLTVLVKLAVFPLDQRSYKSMKEMQILQPKINELREKYKDEREKLNLEILQLYREHKVNPLGGCLPILIQMPIWFALYRVLWNSIELYNSRFLYFCDLTQRDPIAVLPLLLTGAMFLQQKMSPQPQDPSQAAVMRWMPIFFGVLMFTMPAGLVLYIFVSTLLRMAQQYLVNRGGGRPAAPAQAAG